LSHSFDLKKKAEEQEAVATTQNPKVNSQRIVFPALSLMFIATVNCCRDHLLTESRQEPLRPPPVIVLAPTELL
jgi:hypothetical protein